MLLKFKASFELLTYDILSLKYIWWFLRNVVELTQRNLQLCLSEVLDIFSQIMIHSQFSSQIVRGSSPWNLQHSLFNILPIFLTCSKSGPIIIRRNIARCAPNDSPNKSTFLHANNPYCAFLVPIGRLLEQRLLPFPTTRHDRHALWRHGHERHE